MMYWFINMINYSKMIEHDRGIPQKRSHISVNYLPKSVFD